MNHSRYYHPSWNLFSSPCVSFVCSLHLYKMVKPCVYNLIRDVVKPYLDKCTLFGDCNSTRGKDWGERGGMNKDNDHRSEKTRPVKKGWKSQASSVWRKENSGCMPNCLQIYKRPLQKEDKGQLFSLVTEDRSGNKGV